MIVRTPKLASPDNESPPVDIDRSVAIPPSAYSLMGFRDWACSDDFPEFGRISYIGGEILVDMNTENINTHGKVKLEISRVIGNLVIELDLGTVYPDGTLITNTAAELSNEPDCSFATWETLHARRVWEVPSASGVAGKSLEGSLDWVLEVVSPSSVLKDTKQLRERYFRSGVTEYWLVDARQEQIDFSILTRGRTGYDIQPRRRGWVTSPLFEHRFSLQRSEHRGFCRYELLIAPAKKSRR